MTAIRVLAVVGGLLLASAVEEVCLTDDASCLLQSDYAVKPQAKAKKVDVKPAVKPEAKAKAALVSRPLLQQASSSDTERATYQVHNQRFISEGYDLMKAEMKVSQAEVLCGILDKCVGFTFAGEPNANNLFLMHFKKKIVGGVGNWTVYQRMNSRSLYSKAIAEDLTAPGETAPAPAPKSTIARALSKDFELDDPRQKAHRAITWVERPETYLSNHHDWHVGYYNEKMTVMEAKRLCGSLVLCKGFTFKGLEENGKHMVDFKSDITYAGAGAWTSFMKVVTGPAPTPGENIWPEMARPGKGDSQHHPIEEADDSEHVVMETHRTGMAEWASPTSEGNGGKEFASKAEMKRVTGHGSVKNEGRGNSNPTRGYPGEGSLPKAAGNMDYNPEKKASWLPDPQSKHADHQIASINGALAADKEGPSPKVDEKLEVGPDAELQA